MQCSLLTNQWPSPRAHIVRIEMYESHIANSIGNTEITLKGAAMPQGLNVLAACPTAAPPQKANMEQSSTTFPVLAHSLVLEMRKYVMAVLAVSTLSAGSKSGFLQMWDGVL